MIDARKPYRAKNMSVNNSEPKAETGFLDVTVKDKTTNEPVQNADVRIYLLTLSGLYGERGEAKEVVSYTTDEEGKIPRIELPLLNNEPGQNVSLSYHMSVIASEHYNAYALNIQIYPGITTIYDVLLTPYTAGERRYEFIITPPEKLI